MTQLKSQSIRISTQSHQAMVNVTQQVAGAIRASGITDGLVHCFVQHTTCGLTINENADPDVVHDLLIRLEELVPWRHPTDRHAEGNSAAHLRSSLVGAAVSVPIRGGHLQLGTWQGIFLCEFDGPRTRQIVITCISQQG